MVGTHDVCRTIRYVAPVALMFIAGCGTSRDDQAAGYVISILNRIYSEEISGSPFTGISARPEVACSQQEIIELKGGGSSFQRISKKCRIADFAAAGETIFITSPSNESICKTVLDAFKIEIFDILSGQRNAKNSIVENDNEYQRRLLRTYKLSASCDSGLLKIQLVGE